MMTPENQKSTQDSRIDIGVSRVSGNVPANNPIFTDIAWDLDSDFDSDFEVWLWLSVWALTLFTTPTPSLTQTLNGANNHAKYAKSFDKRSAGVKALFGPFSSVIGVPVYEFRPENLLQNCVASLDVYFHQTRHLNVSPVLSFIFFCLFANCSLCRRPLIFAVTIPVTTRPNSWQRLSGWLRLRHLVTLRLTL